jgi:hypothetical protein
MFKPSAGFVVDEQQKGTEDTVLIQEHVYVVVVGFGQSE